jgi:hypothetical protein
MPIQSDWETDEKRVIVCTYTGRWSLEEFYRTLDLCAQLMDTVDYPVNLIFDMRNSTSLPDGFMTVIRNVSRRPHQNLGIMAIVGASRLVQVFTDLVRKVSKGSGNRTTYMVGTLEEAHDLFAVKTNIPSG